MSGISRRQFLGIFRRNERESERPERSGFSLERFYAARGSAPPLEVPEGGGASVVRIRPDTCLAYASFCSTCSERCPVEGAIVVELGRPRIDETRCTGCKLCVSVCPAPLNGLELVARASA